MNQRVGCLRNIEEITARYLNYVLKSNTILESVFEQETGTANQANIGADVVRNIMIPFPPIEEQQHIVEKLDRILNLRIELIDETKKAENLSSKIMKNLFKNVL
nr:restriction endonuclease subunit S [Lysinibacillus boronitolerans]